jgi:hypothetical protein
MLIPAIVAVVLGHKALGQIQRSNGSLGGGGLAVGGLVTGYLGILIGGAISSLVVLGIFSDTLKQQLGGAVEQPYDYESDVDAATSQESVEFLRDL